MAKIKSELQQTNPLFNSIKMTCWIIFHIVRYGCNIIDACIKQQCIINLLVLLLCFIVENVLFKHFSKDLTDVLIRYELPSKIFQEYNL